MVVRYSGDTVFGGGGARIVGGFTVYIYISGTKPQGLFNSASFSHRRPHFNSDRDRQILRYSVLLGLHENI